MKPIEMINQARLQRHSAYQAARLLNTLPGEGDKNSHLLTWDSLLSIPDWCFWPEDKRHALASTAGALFLAPVMRLWIDAVRIRQAREVLGDLLFDAVMMHKNLPQEVQQPPENVPVNVLLLSTGASVLLGSLLPQLQHKLTSLLPPLRGNVPTPLAKQLAEEAQTLLLRLTADYIAAQEADVIQNTDPNDIDTNNTVTKDTDDEYLAAQQEWEKAYDHAH